MQEVTCPGSSSLRPDRELDPFLLAVLCLEVLQTPPIPNLTISSLDVNPFFASDPNPYRKCPSQKKILDKLAETSYVIQASRKIHKRET